MMISVWTIIILIIPTIALVFFFIDYRKKRLSSNIYKDADKFSRLEYLKYFLVAFTLAVLGEFLVPLPQFLFMLLFLLIFLGMLYITIKRLHDINMNGWWAIVNIFPLSSLIMLLICFFTPSSKNTNDF